MIRLPVHNDGAIAARPRRWKRWGALLLLTAAVAVLSGHTGLKLIETGSIMLAEQVAPSAPPPTRIGINLFGLNDYYRQQVFTNLIEQGEWFSSYGKGWSAMPPVQLDRAGGVLFLEPGQTAPRTLTLPPAPYRPTRVRCTFRGKGRIDAGGVARAVARMPGELLIELTPTGAEDERGWIELVETERADPVRELDCRETTRAPDERFHPEFLSFLKGFAILRFLDWQRTNDNAPVRWDLRATPASGSQVTGAGASVEDMVALANRTKADPWFLMPYQADADYVRSFAQLVRARLDPDRTVYVELGNEIWNDQFDAARAARAEGLALGLGGGDPMQAQAIRYAQKLCPVMAIWRQAFADRPDRLVRVAASQNANPDMARIILGFERTADCVDALATAPYIWVDLEGHDGDVQWVFDRMPAAIDDTLTFAARNRAIAARFGKRFIAYEGGQHLVTRNVAFARQLQRDPRMGFAYRTYLDRWRRTIGDDLVLYASTAPIGEYGSWGLREYAGQPLSAAPKLAAVRRVMESGQ
ncbi:hypothetical protein [Sphingomonas sp. IW22]|uniref:hypothetical protein n=1 Tax=Sphingomonas sp. IW22 TaxID=3242489 RepID=UPI00351FD972